jgi:peptidoglycan-N-acetylglucosamine deacetylase
VTAAHMDSSASSSRKRFARPTVGTRAATLGLAAIHAFPALTAATATLHRPLGVTGRTEEAGVALTFDDGPHPKGTPAVLASLDAHRARATFFLAGEQVRRYPALAREIVAAGNEVGLHGDRHRLLLLLTPAQTRDDLDRGFETIAEATGLAPRLWRPPYGILSTAALLHARRRGWETVLWSRHGRDWASSATPKSIFVRLEPGLESGGILLLHDADHYAAPGSWARTAQSLELLLTALDERGLPTARVQPTR